MLQPAIFLDRDQTLNEDPGYLADPAAVRLLPGVGTGLRRLQEHGLPLVLISNQAGVGRGYFDKATLDAVHARLVELLAEEGVHLVGAYYCLHAPTAGCDCRKPAPGMLLQAAREHGFSLAHSVMVGDKLSDVEAGRAAGCQTILIQSHALSLLPPSVDAVCVDLVEAAAWILARSGQ